MLKADNTQKRCFVACDEQAKKDGRCTCLSNRHQALQLQQTGVMACFSEEQLSQINKYGKHQHNRGTMDLSYVSFEFWLK